MLERFPRSTRFGTDSSLSVARTTTQLACPLVKYTRLGSFHGRHLHISVKRRSAIGFAGFQTILMLILSSRMQNSRPFWNHRGRAPGEFENVHAR